ncbi:MAG: hypothetical protein FJ271_15770 [Planctomycetes bacterium]|nr:hypothetical protein [Planctomycetota bacterium]
MNHVKTATGETLLMSITTEKDSRLLGREPVTMSDLYPARDETWLRAIREGALPADLGELICKFHPGENRTADQLSGFTVELGNAARSYRKSFPASCLAGVARRGTLRLVKETTLQEGDTFAYYLTALRNENLDEPADQGHAHSARRRIVAPVFESRPLAPLLADSAALHGNWASADDDDSFPPVFVPEAIWRQGQAEARRGGDNESAGVWTGRMYRDTASSEIFLVVDACLQAELASEEKYAVRFTGETWSRLRDTVNIRREKLQRPHERILGSVHGHNFCPDADDQGTRTCEHCHTVKVCTRTTAIASPADLDWHRSVFVAQPWALLMVWGFNAREQDDWRLYGLNGGTLSPRGVRVMQQ